MNPESYEGTFIDDPVDPGIVDAFGNVYRLTGTNQVSVNGMIDPEPGAVTALAYMGRKVWRKDHNDNWRNRRRTQDPWGPSQRVSPILLERLERIEDQVGRTGNSVHFISLQLVEMRTILDQVLALVSVDQPKKLAIDMANAEIRPQPVPDKPGP